MKRKEKPEVYSITGARSGRSDDVADRTRQYLFWMGIRTICFVGAVVAHGPLRWAMLAAALFLPYIAVVMANAVRSSTANPGPDPVTPEDVPGIEGGREGRR